MSKPLVYIDQNIIGLQLCGKLHPSKQTGFYWVYSKEHFSEIRRSTNAQQYLFELERIGAKLLDLELNSEWKITETARLHEEGTPAQHYESYIEAMSDVDCSETIFDPFQAWVNGGGDEGLLRDLPSQLAEQILVLSKDVPNIDNELTEKYEKINIDLINTIEQMIEHGNDLKKTRKAFGNEKGTIGCIGGDNQIEQIWHMISPVCEGVSCDRFFGFDPLDKQGYNSWPLYLGILGCCAVLDVVGFQAEKKCRKIEKIPNVRSDATHIAMGAFCSAILSEDKRLIKRAKAIYDYKGIRTSALLVN